VNVRLTRQTAEGARVESVVRITNPNDVELAIDSATIRMNVRGVDAFISETEPAIALPPNASQTFTVAAAFPRDSGVASLEGAAYRLSTTVHFVPPGEIREILTESGVPLPFLTVSRSGRLSTGGSEPVGAGPEADVGSAE
jgi:hypothetical protein